MSKRSEANHADSLDNRWSFTDSKTNATTTPQLIGDSNSSKEVRHLDWFHWSILNKNTLDFTMTGVIRDASAAGTALAQWAMILKGSQMAMVAPANIHLTATPGKGFFFTNDTVHPSVTSNVNAGGWTDQFG